MVVTKKFNQINKNTKGILEVKKALNNLDNKIDSKLL
jgi:hypothetical protein